MYCSGRFFLALLISLDMGLLAPPARAQGTDSSPLPSAQPVTTQAQARALIDAGNDAFHIGHWAAAVQDLTQALPFFQSDQDFQANVLDLIGLSYLKLAQPAKALEMLDQALPLYQDAADVGGSARALNFIGEAYRDQSLPARALDFYDRALLGYTAIEDGTGQAFVLSDIGSAYRSLQQPAKALDFYHRSLLLYQEARNETAQGSVLSSMGFASLDLGRPDESLNEFYQALPLLTRAADADGLANADFGIGKAYFGLGQPAKSLDYHTQALTLFLAANDRTGQGKALCGIGSAHLRLGQYATALDDYLQALPLFQETGDKSLQAITLNNLGEARRSLSQYPEALDYDTQALSLYQAVGDRSGQAGALNTMGMVDLDLRRTNKALECFAKALSLFQDARDNHGQAIVLDDIGTAYHDMSQYAEALEYHLQVPPLLRDTGDKDAQGIAFNNIGNDNASLGQPAQALDFYLQALPLLEDAGDKNSQARVMSDIANVYDSLGQYAKALDYQLRALPMIQETGDQDAEASLLNNLGETYRYLNHPETALSCYAQARHLAEAIGDESIDADTLNNTGNTYLSLNQFEKSLDYLSQAQARSREAGDKDGQAEALDKLMWAYSKMPHRMRLAVLFGKQAVNLCQSVRGGLATLGTSLQQSYLKSKEPIYQDLADVLIQQHRLPEAQQVLHLLKEREFYDFLHQTPDAASVRLDGLVFTRREKKWITRYQHVVEPLEALGQQKIFAALKVRTPEQQTQLAILNKQLSAAEAALKHVQDQALLDFSGPATADDAPLGIAQADQLAHALPRGAVVLYTIVATDAIQLILVTKTKTTAYHSPIQANKLYDLVLALRGALIDPAKDPRPLAGQIYNLVLRPVRHDLIQAHAKTILFSLDDALRYIPPAALYDPGTKRYVAQDYRTELITLVAAPPASSAEATPAVLGLGVSRPQDGAPALPGVKQELDALIRQPGHPNGIFPGASLLDAAFTRSAMTKALEKHAYPIVHIASHFALHATDDASYLLMGDGSKMSVTDLRREPHRFAGVDLLTLSACETAMEVKASSGGEVEGIGVLAQTLGAQDVIASLWPVSDEVTPQLMATLYRWRRAHPEEPLSEALRQAQVSLLTGTAPDAVKTDGGARGTEAVGPAEPSSAPAFTRDPNAPYAHPYYWAPFILIGNWR